MRTRPTLRCLVAGLFLSAAGCENKAAPSPPPTPERVISLTGNLQFGNVDIGATSEATLTIRNSGNQALIISGITGPAGYSANWTNGGIAPNGTQAVIVKFSPTAHRSYSGTVTVNGDQTSGANTIAISGQGIAPIFRFNGSGDSVFDMPVHVERIKIIGTYTANSSNFIVKIATRLIVNELLGTFWNQTRYEGTLLTGGGGVVAITNSSGVVWSFEEIR